jgi:hypothetical protein
MVDPVPDPRLDAKKASPALTAALIGAALLSGVVIVVFSSLQGRDVFAHQTTLVWLACVLPLAWVARSPALGAIAALLFLLWSPLFALRDMSVTAMIDRAVLLPVLVLLAGLVLFSFGGLHYVVPPFARLARAVRIVGIQAAIVALFALTLEPIAAGTSWFNDLRDTEATARITWALLALAVVAGVFTLINIVLAPRIRSITVVEGPISLALIGCAVLYVVVPLPAAMFTLMFTVVALAMTVAVTAVGFGRNDARVFRVGAAGTCLVGLLRYVEWMWERASLAGAIGGGLAILVVGIVVVEAVGKRLRAAKKK